MLYKYYDYEEDQEEYISHRYFCECGEPTHVLCIDEWREPKGGEIIIAIAANPRLGLWKRIKDAVKLILGKEVWYADVVLCEKDRDELARVIAGKDKDK